MTKRLSIKQRLSDLGYDSIDTIAINCDWHDLLGDDLEGWVSYEAQECDKCGKLVVLNAGQGEDEHKDHYDELKKCPKCGDDSFSPFFYEGEKDDSIERLICDGCGEVYVDPSKCEGYLSSVEGPMMNYWYPIQLDDCEDAAKKIAHLPLCVVQFKDGTTGLALTGGGMDLSWEICEAFMCLGRMPPVAFEPPAMCGRGVSEKDRWIMAGYIESCKAVMGRMQRKIERLKDTAKFGREYAARTAKKRG